MHALWSLTIERRRRRKQKQACVQRLVFIFVDLNVDRSRQRSNEQRRNFVIWSNANPKPMSRIVSKKVIGYENTSNISKSSEQLKVFGLRIRLIYSYLFGHDIESRNSTVSHTLSGLRVCILFKRSTPSTNLSIFVRTIFD